MRPGFGGWDIVRPPPVSAGGSRKLDVLSVLSGSTSTGFCDGGFRTSLTSIGLGFVMMHSPCSVSCWKRSVPLRDVAVREADSGVTDIRRRPRLRRVARLVDRNRGAGPGTPGSAVPLLLPYRARRERFPS